MALTIAQDTSAEEFLEKAGPLLYQDEPTNSLMLGLCGDMMGAKEPINVPPAFLRVLSDGKIVSAAILNSMNLVITFAKPDELELLAKHLQDNHAVPPGVVGPAVESEIFANLWSKISGKSFNLGMSQRIYKIERVSMPVVRGQLRLARPEEVDLITQWSVEFANESLPPKEHKPFSQRRPQAVRAIERSLAYVWEVDGVPVSMAHVGRPTQNGISVSAVYTPPNLRKKGFASAVVGHLSQKMLDSGKKFCVLYTDLSNNTSNKIYQNLGYQEVADSKHFIFDDRA